MLHLMEKQKVSKQNIKWGNWGAGGLYSTNANLKSTCHNQFVKMLEMIIGTYLLWYEYINAIVLLYKMELVTLKATKFLKFPIFYL